jgi:histidinol-phosphate aminotransferase
MSLPIRTHIKRMSTYTPGQSLSSLKHEFGLSNPIKLDSNENPMGPSPKAIDSAIRALEKIQHYPDASGRALKNAIAKELDLSEAEIVVGNGSDELIHYLGLCLLESGDEIIVATPGFIRYSAIGQLIKADVVHVNLDDKERHDLNAIQKAVNEKTRIIWIANPHNPTGTIVTALEFRKFMESIPPNIVVVLDEAYIEYANGANVPNARDEVKHWHNVFGLRTFSKAYGLAGMRIGYGIGDSNLIGAIEKIRQPFNVNAIAQSAAINALADKDHLKKSIELANHSKETLYEIFSAMEVHLTKSYANFIWVDMRQNAYPLYEYLLGKGIIVRPGTQFGRPNHLRISIGLHEQMTRLQEEIENYRTKTN